MRKEGVTMMKRAKQIYGMVWRDERENDATVLYNLEHKQK